MARMRRAGPPLRGFFHARMVEWRSMSEGPGKRRRFQFSLRALLVVVTLLVLCLGWEADRAAKQQRAVDMVLTHGGEVLYEHQRTATDYDPQIEPWAPRWLRDLVGEHHFITASEVHIPAYRYVDCWKDQRREPPESVKSVTEEEIALLGDLGSLHMLFLENVPVTDAGVRHLARLKSLAYLHLIGSQIADDALDTISRLTQLTHLTLGGKRGPHPAAVTRVTDDGLARLTNLQNLKFLWLDGTRVSDEGLKHVAKLASLEDLGLQDTAITDAGLAYLRGLPNLRTIALTNPKITDRGLEALTVHANLDFLSLAGTGVTDSGLAHLRSLAKLELLDLAHTSITGAGLAGLTSLERLFVGNTRVNDAALCHIAQMSKLSMLSLEATSVTDAGLDQLQGLTRLTDLNLADTQVTDQALERLGTGPVRWLSLEGTKVSKPAADKLRQTKQIIVHTDADPNPQRGT